MKCKWCEKDFEDRKHPNKKYCSYKCSGLGRRKTGDIKCEQCGKEFHKKPSHIKRVVYNYCSMICRSQSKKYKETLSNSNKLAWKESRKKPTIQKGKDHHWWKGGIARLPYPWDFNKELKELIRKRDNYKCQICSCPQEECLRQLDVHHKDFNKNNNDPKNLVALCHKCHSKIIKEIKCKIN